jgi:alkylhydroperoxidase family enzyme
MTPKYPDVTVQLSGEDGNAFMVLGLCQRAAKRAGLSEAEISEFMKEATANNYSNVLNTAMEWFDVR